MSQNASPPTTTVGQVSADGQFRWDGAQWVPIARGEREPTSWTRPLKLAAAGLFVTEALYSVIVSLVYVNASTMRRILEQQGTRVPQGTDLETIVNITVVTTLAVIFVIAVCEIVAAIGSYLGWRWMFWVALVLFAFGGLGAFTNIGTLLKPETSPIPLWGIAISELFAVASLGLFIWMLIAVIKFGPWAMRRPA